MAYVYTTISHDPIANIQYADTLAGYHSVAPSPDVRLYHCLVLISLNGYHRNVWWCMQSRPVSRTAVSHFLTKFFSKGSGLFGIAMAEGE
jgi:hypothetical protein